MEKTVTIDLSEPIAAEGAECRSIAFREPTAAELQRIGEIHRDLNVNGVTCRIENEGAIQDYLAVCLIQPKDPQVLDQINLSDGMQIKAAIIYLIHTARSRMIPARLN